MSAKHRESPTLFPEMETADRLWHEKEAWGKGCLFVAGVDEAGRGPLAGPVVAAAVILDPERPVEGLDDSKRLSPKTRDRLFLLLRRNARSIGVGIVDHARIDEVNILNASLEAMKRAVSRLGRCDFLLVDGTFPVPITVPQKTIIRGDSLSLSVSAASIVAKVVRDRKMAYYHCKYPDYNFLSNKGYGTSEHLDAIARHGICPIHRTTFSGVKEHASLPFPQ